MTPQDLISLMTGLFILGMIWLRTRMYYSRRLVGALRLTRHGRMYFTAALALIIVGWLSGPALGRVSMPTMAAGATLMRVLWFLAAYYLFIAVHGMLGSRKIKVFEPVDAQGVER